MSGHLHMSEKERKRESMFDEVLVDRPTLRQARESLGRRLPPGSWPKTDWLCIQRRCVGGFRQKVTRRGGAVGESTRQEGTTLITTE